MLAGPGKGKLLETENRSVVANSWEDGLGERLTTKGHERPFWGDSNVPHLDFDDGGNMFAYLYQNC